MNDTTLIIVSQHPHLGISLDHTSKHSVTEPMVHWDSLNAMQLYAQPSYASS